MTGDVCSGTARADCDQSIVNFSQTMDHSGGMNLPEELSEAH